jgi:DNA-directed RNA polymerase subunit RPC12/RpoP
MTYKDQLKQEEWYNKREEIKLRDQNKCIKCGSRIELHVHHTYYKRNLKAWEYPDECYQTLCAICHKKVHNKYIYTKEEQKIREQNVIPVPHIITKETFIERRNESKKQAKILKDKKLELIRSFRFKKK